MTSKLSTENNMAAEVKNTVTCTIKVKVPNALAQKLEKLYEPSLVCARRMLKRREESSSKYYKQVPCVIAKSLIAKYQRNLKCKNIRNLVLPVCGDKGRQIKVEAEGIRIPAIFGKEILPVVWVHPLHGHVRQAECYRREGQWYAAVSYNTPKQEAITVTGVIGVDRNSVGNVAVFADPSNGIVRKLGLCPARTKMAMRGRRKNLQRAGKFRLLSKLRRKQRRRMTYENHRASKSIVDYAAANCRAVAIEKLDGIRAVKSKIRHYSEKNQWAFFQLETFLRYKCAFRGIPVIEVDPAYTSQMCSRCGQIHKPEGKQFVCASCGHHDHRDANAALNIALRGLERTGESSGSLSVLPLRPIGSPLAGKGGSL
jgi:IS605 OrfB family transposase